jgi:hypothetical protein
VASADPKEPTWSTGYAPLTVGHLLTIKVLPSVTLERAKRFDRHIRTFEM